ncbi:MAG TPA: amidohydrolase family protein [Acidimicrobiales bacterium]|nr:amidohydrolase family protein [Acidimicrobiales bacterium]
MNYVVISADCHAGPNSPTYRDYLDPAYHEDFDEELAERQRLLEERRAGAAPALFTGDEEFQDEWFGPDAEGDSLHDIGLRGGWDAATRDRELDRDGVAAEVVFPGPDAVTGTMGAPFGAGFNPVATRSPEHLLAGARAYNRWAAGLCSQSPARRAGLIVAPILGDLEGAIAEIRRAHAEGLRGGVIIPPQWGSYASYTSYRYDPVWAACEELSLPIHCHSGPAPQQDYGNVRGWMSVYGYETIFFTSRPLWFMLLTGVFERFAGLKMAVTEAGSYWAADMLWRMDMMATREHGMRKMVDTRGILKMLPSEYFDRNCKIGSSNTRRRELARRYEIGVGNIMWGNDFPHPEGTWPYTRTFLRDRFWDVPIDETAQILGQNQADFYGFDLVALQAIADRIGPTPDDLGQSDESVTRKWDALRRAGRPWLTDEEAVAEPVG